MFGTSAIPCLSSRTFVATKDLKQSRKITATRFQLACNATGHTPPPQDSTAELASGRRQALLLTAGSLALLRPGLSHAAEATATAASPSSSSLPPELKELVEAIGEVKGDGSPKSAEELNTLKGLGLVAIVGLVLIPLVKVVLAGGIGLTTVKYLQKERLNRKGGAAGALSELLGETKDPLDENLFEVKRIADERVSGMAAVTALTQSKAAAEAIREKERERKVLTGWGSLVDGLEAEKKEKVTAAIKEFTKSEEKRRKEMEDARKLWREAVLSKDFSGLTGPLARMNMEGLSKDQIFNEVVLFDTLQEHLSKSQLKELTKVLAGTDLLPPPPLSKEGAGHETVYVLNFEGDTQASGVEALSKEIGVILSMSERPSEVILKVTSPGGTVTGYGLAAALLQRVTGAGIKLTICVDQLAASGGYLMACVADQILCSPYAAVGSIGVVAQLPNVADRLEREGVEFITTTAGKWKRTVTPFKKPTEEELAKQQEDIKAVYTQFAHTVKTQRPHLEIDQVATGEVWYGNDALIRGLVDDLMTSSEYISHRMNEGAELFSLKFKPKKPGLAGALAGSSLPSDLLQGLLQQRNSSSTLSGLDSLTRSDVEQFQFLAKNVLPKMEALPLEARIQLARTLFKLD